MEIDFKEIPRQFAPLAALLIFETHTLPISTFPFARHARLSAPTNPKSTKSAAARPSD